MWSLKTPSRPRGDDEGMVLLWVAVSIIVLLGMGALTIDLGALYLEKRQLQNGADAAALAIAFNCAKSTATPSCGSVMTIANTLADGNSKDGFSAVPKVCGVGPGLSASGCTTPSGLSSGANWVQVFTSTETSGGGTKVPMVLAPLIGGASGKTVKANATAQWGGLQSSQALPIVLSACEFTKLGGKLDGSAFPNASTATIYFHILGDPNEPGVGSCTPSTSGAPISGGFGLLRSNNCISNLTANAWSTADTSNTLPSSCNPNSWTGVDKTFALYDNTRGSGNPQYHLVGFVSFKITRWRFGASSSSPSFQCPAAPGNTGICIQGTFTKATKSGGSPGGPNLGLTTIKLIG
jgi:Putative Flp pilus-assembly TadE/G-like